LKCSPQGEGGGKKKKIHPSKNETKTNYRVLVWEAEKKKRKRETNQRELAGGERRGDNRPTSPRKKKATKFQRGQSKM